MDNIKTKLKEVLSIEDLDITEKTTIKDVLNTYNSREDTTIKEAVKNMLFESYETLYPYPTIYHSLVDGRMVVVEKVNGSSNKASQPYSVLVECTESDEGILAPTAVKVVPLLKIIYSNDTKYFAPISWASNSVQGVMLTFTDTYLNEISSAEISYVKLEIIADETFTFGGSALHSRQLKVKYKIGDDYVTFGRTSGTKLKIEDGAIAFKSGTLNASVVRIMSIEDTSAYITVVTNSEITVTSGNILGYLKLSPPYESVAANQIDIMKFVDYTMKKFGVQS